MRASGGSLLRKAPQNLSGIFRCNKGDVGFFTSPCSHGSLKKSRTVVSPSKGEVFQKAHDHFISVKITDAHHNVPRSIVFFHKMNNAAQNIPIRLPLATEKLSFLVGNAHRRGGFLRVERTRRKFSL